MVCIWNTYWPAMGERLARPGQGGEDDVNRQLLLPLDRIVFTLFNTIRSTGKFPETWRMAALI